MKIGRLLTVGALGILLTFAPRVEAAVTAFNVVNMSGNQRSAGSSGMDFRVLPDPIEILNLGVVDSESDRLQSPSVSIGNYQRNTQTIIAPVMSFSGLLGSLIDGSRYQSLLIPMTGWSGHNSAVAWGYGSNDLDGNTGCGASNGGLCAGMNPSTSTMGNAPGLVSYLDSGRYSPIVGDSPAILDGGPMNRYLAGTYQYPAFSAIPEPATMSLMGISLAGLALWARRKKK